MRRPIDYIDPLTEREELQLFNFQFRRFLITQNEIEKEGEDGEEEGISEENGPKILKKWDLLGPIIPYEWQKECLDKWKDNGYQGVVKVVTGAGKTIFALSAIQELRNSIDGDFSVCIVVPTIVLMHQWYDTIVKNSNIPKETICRIGGGFTEHLSEKKQVALGKASGKRIIIGVINSLSSSKILNGLKRTDGERRLLVVDECHHLTAGKMGTVVDIPHKYSLGLSATPDSGDEQDEGESRWKELGDIIYTLSYQDAIAAGFLSKYTIFHYGLEMEMKNRLEYEKHSRAASEAAKALKPRHKASKSKLGYFAWVQQCSGKGDTTALEYLTAISNRKKVLYSDPCRLNATVEICKAALRKNRHARILVFHESIDEVQKLYDCLYKLNFKVVIDHSEMSSDMRAQGIAMFRNGVANILVSPKTLVEGFDVPSVDVGIVAASSGSVRQRIQTIGRVLRKDPNNPKKKAKIHVLYVNNTIDKNIYEELDWNDLVGAESNTYYVCDANGEKRLCDGPPASPKPKDSQIDFDTLDNGSVYPGNVKELEEFSCDSSGSIRDGKGNLVVFETDVLSILRSVKGYLGQFKLSPTKHALIIPVKTGQDTELIFSGFVDTPKTTDVGTTGKRCVKLKCKQNHGMKLAFSYSADGICFMKDACAAPILTKMKEIEYEEEIKVKEVCIEEDGTAYCIVKSRKVLLAEPGTTYEFPDNIQLFE